MVTFSLSFFVASNPLQAQCPMCKIAAESNLNQGGDAGRGLNSGILYLFATPYLMVGLLGYIWWRNRKKEEDLDETAEI
ncbi:MAG: hypothetical protein GY705_13215 [Bacteroidetes bacterium]|nr:hypothetical protein [Bacteroidota bacterium]